MKVGSPPEARRRRAHKLTETVRKVGLINLLCRSESATPPPSGPRKTKPRLRGVLPIGLSDSGGIGGIRAAVATCLLSVSRELPVEVQRFAALTRP